MRRAMLMLVAVVSGCGGGPVHEGLSERANVDGQGQADAGSQPVSSCGGAQQGEEGDPIHVTGSGVDYQRPTCDLAAMNRPSISPPTSLHGADAPTAELTEVAQLMVGEWRGIQTSPWDGTNDVRITFFENGRYSAAALGQSPILYYGAFCAYHQEFWRLEYGARALAFGEMTAGAGFDCWSPKMTLRRIQVDSKTLRFEAWLREYGPVVVQLERVTREAP